MRFLFEWEAFGLGLRIYSEPIGLEIYVGWFVLDIHFREAEAV